MFQIIQSELYRIRKNRLFFLCLLLSTFFMFAYALTYHYDTVKTVGLTGGIASLNGFTEFLFSDYSLVIPMTIFQLIYVTEDYQKGIHEILFMKGVSRFDFFFGKLLALWIATLFYLIFSFFMAYLFILSTWIKQPYIEFSLTGICGYLILQILCFIGYSSFLWLLSCLIPYRNIVLVVSFFLLGTLYLYLTKISTALDLEYSLYKYWINSTINIQRIFLHFLSSQINYLRRIHNIFIYKRAIADYGCVVSEYLYRAGLRKLGACPFFFPAQKNRRAARKIGALLICATLCLMSFVMFLPFSIGTLDVLNGQHGPIVFILLVCFTITLIEIDLMQGFDEVLVCMGQILKQLSIKTQNLYPM